LAAIARGALLGEGAYAAVWRYDDVAVKLTCDPAALALSEHLSHSPVAALPRVYRVDPDVACEDGQYSYGAVTMELLTPMSAKQFVPIERLYRQCRAEAVLRYKQVARQSSHVASLMADRLPRLRSSALRPHEPERLAGAMKWLAAYMKESGFCADFGQRRNWMLTQAGDIVMADPVVVRIHALDATRSLPRLPPL
jgi:hypothetical protein